MVLSGRTVVSSGDVSAIAAARAFLEGDISAAEPRWTNAWLRMGWTPKSMAPIEALLLAALAGNAAKFPRRPRSPIFVEMLDQHAWQDPPRARAEAGIEYGIAGVVATYPDRVTAPASGPIVYVEDPRHVIDELGLVEAPPVQRIMLAPVVASELVGLEADGGLMLVSRAQTMPDNFASGGRQPDNAEAVALSWPQP